MKKRRVVVSLSSLAKIDQEKERLRKLRRRYPRRYKKRIDTAYALDSLLRKNGR